MTLPISNVFNILNVIFIWIGNPGNWSTTYAFFPRNPFQNVDMPFFRKVYFDKNYYFCSYLRITLIFENAT